MAQRFSQADKGIWVTGPSRSSRRPPVKNPAVDNKALIEEHKFTLIETSTFRLPYQPLRAQNSGSWQQSSHGEATYGLDWKNDKNFRFTYRARKDPHFQRNSTRDSDPPARRHSAKERLSFEKVVVSESQGLFVSTSRNEWRPVQTRSQTGTNSKTSLAQVSHTPSPRPQREGKLLHTPTSHQKSNEESLPFQERRSALDKLSLPKKGFLSYKMESQTLNQDYLEENLTVHQPGGSNIPSSSRKQNRVTPDQYDPSQDRSTIRTLSEDRLHVSLRLCSFREPDEPMESIPIAKKRTRATNSSAPLLSSKVDGPSHTNMREQKSPAQAIDSARIEELKTILETAYAEEEAFWRQRSCVQWLSARDKNTSFCTRKVWELAPVCLVPNLSTCTYVSDLLSRGLRMTNLPPMDLVSPPYPWIMWVLWTSCNQLIFFSEAEMILRAIKLAKEWQATQPSPTSKSASSKDYLPQANLVSQIPHVPVNALLCFSDVAWNSSSGDGGFGWVVKGSDGLI
ncbi:hypothetical protein HID58_055226, partial [Brassica napus]